MDYLTRENVDPVRRAKALCDLFAIPDFGQNPTKEGKFPFSVCLIFVGCLLDTLPSKVGCYWPLITPITFYLANSHLSSLSIKPTDQQKKPNTSFKFHCLRLLCWTSQESELRCTTWQRCESQTDDNKIFEQTMEVILTTAPHSLWILKIDLLTQTDDVLVAVSNQFRTFEFFALLNV